MRQLRIREIHEFAEYEIERFRPIPGVKLIQPQSKTFNKAFAGAEALILIILILCQQSQEVRVLDAATFASVKSIAVGGVPRGMSLSAKGDRLYVTNSWDDTLSVIDTTALTVIATWHVGSEPSGVVADPTATYLFVANRVSDDIAVLNAQTGEEEKRLAGGRVCRPRHAGADRDDCRSGAVAPLARGVAAGR